MVICTKREIKGVMYSLSSKMVISIYGSATPPQSEESFKQRLRQLGIGEKEIEDRYRKYYETLVKYPLPMIITRLITLEGSERHD